MSIKTSPFLVILIILLNGCATQAFSTAHYNEKESIRINNEAVVNKSFESVWSDLVKNLAKSFFDVNNIEKDSRLINVSFSTDVPEKYIDCGNTTRTFSQGSEKLNYNYDVAKDSAYKYGAGRSNDGSLAFVGHVKRSTNLEGRINIYVAPNGENTEVSVNTRYILTMLINGSVNTENANGYVVSSQPIVQPPSIISFNTNKSNKSNEGVSCFANGVLETEILKMAELN
jgi:hypothetical protein